MKRLGMIHSIRAVLASVCMWGIACAADAQSPESGESRRQEFNISAGDLREVLEAYIAQAHIELIYRLQDIAGRRSQGVQGAHTAEEALARLLQGTGLLAQKQASGALAIVRGNASGDRRETVEEIEVEEVVVLGTNIRGAAPDSSPVQVYNRSDIQRSGAGTTQEFIQTLAQNFSGGSNSTLVRGTPYDTGSSNNLSLGSSVNLRGLGSGATLVLVNGQRLAPSSTVGDFVDISMIPLNAIERVEVLTDGASGIYGGDAVAGVVNFVLRDHYDGAETYASYGNVTQGSSAEIRAGQTLGWNWNSGNVLASYDFHKQENLTVLDRDFSKAIGLPIDLSPQQERHAALLSATQRLSDRIEVFGNALWGQRDALVTRSNTQTAPTRSTVADAEQFSLITGLRADLWGDWSLEPTASYSEVRNASFTPRVLNGGFASSRVTEADQWSMEAKASGSLFDLPGGALKAAVGGGVRQEGFQSTDRLTGMRDRDVDRDVSYAFVELLAPLVGAPNALPGLHRLEINVSGRSEDYSDFGSASNPKVGLLWSPLNGLNLRGTYGTSFNPPDLGRVAPVDTEAYVFTNDILNALLVQNPEVSSSVPALFVLGTDPQLQPEESEAWTAGFDFTRQIGRGVLSVKSTYFDIRFSDRINLVQVPGGAFNVYNIGLCCANQLPPGTVVVDPGADLVSEVIAAAQNQEGFFDQFGIYDGSPASIGMIAYVTLRNLAKTTTRGVDIDVSYGFDTAAGSLGFSLTGNYLFEFSNQSSATTPTLDQVDTIFRPVDLRLRGGVVWSSGQWTSALFVNYTDAYVDDRPVVHKPVPSWTTVDANVSYAVSDANAVAWLRNLRIDLIGSNLLDRQPPFIGNDFQFGILGYDPTNASARGRFLALRVTKGW